MLFQYPSRPSSDATWEESLFLVIVPRYPITSIELTYSLLPIHVPSKPCIEPRRVPIAWRDEEGKWMA